MLEEDSLWKVFVEIEMKLLPIIADMERRGVCIDLAKLNAMEEVLLTRMKLVEQQCYQAAGKTFQINSAMQVRAILYDELQLDTKCNIKIRETICKGAKSTSESMLRSLVSEHPLPRLILEYRHLHKAHATFLTGIAQHVKDGVVRPTWVQTAAATGRIASNNPNLQAIPKAPFSLVMFPDAADDADQSQLKFRSVYVARGGCVLLAADFQHVECRVFAHAAQDRALLAALATADDLFQVLAAQWLKKPEAEIVSEERERTKRLVYASLYGAGTRKLMEILGVSYQEALQVAASFNSEFCALHTSADSTGAQAPGDPRRELPGGAAGGRQLQQRRCRWPPTSTVSSVHCTLAQTAPVHKLMEILGVSYQEALQVAASFNSEFCALHTSADSTGAQAPGDPRRELPGGAAGGRQLQQ
ncbi:hypothetical protein PYW07_017474 [Mythimna separata]|uniref:DNA-directed DNA polymerase family A palm domain-containing protein n=1 Tax=Mythimna separata TaxID=271217 RepID=A0AAD7YVI6_MYTSE|nr:hypothetical protein PYW07_017474 [Mythimna separata]